MFGALCVSILKQARICEKKIRPSAQVQVVKLWKMSFSTEPSSRGEFTYIAFPDKPTYLSKLNRNCAKENDHCAGLTDASDIVSGDKGHHTLLVIQPQVSDEDMVAKYIQTGVISQRIIRDLPADFPGGFSLCYSSSSNVVKRGVCVYYKDEERDVILPEIKRILHGQNVRSYFRFSNNRNGRFKRTEHDTTTEDIIDEATYCLSGNQTQSAIFSVPDFTPVFNDYARTRLILQQTSDVPEVAELLTIADRLIPQDLNVQQLQENMKHPFVVVEGMDATGKTTLTKILGDRLSAVRLYTPPPPIEHLRKIFDRLPELVRRAYYSIGNYIVAMEISKECQERAVVMDRYWHSTAAYGIANESSTGDLPRSGHPVYQWPTDLLRPTAVLFLTVGEEKRKQRLQGRGIEKTFEERSLDKDQLFRQRLCDAYRRMENPSLVEVDASGTVEEVVKSAIEKLTNCGVYVPSDTHV
ncbi:UMP-CMP kinase 2, mitochondrial-like isoform X1 [Mizuhopecten yessoensis]|uniref:UMP-CMP kinase 2, mitochondrial n=1 Tax=Mizuhopecten yessoensis TaxID=6573 RepID=A0A210PII4_MIZYE|nr:UMP-CMP kinase 2, mitochondrial-like isoform X1 [Mizuhopecten yessoensis]OWF36295.1 UMP-CMP kinase 2, mitochondrial [Mizuhopecten yessoensis]